MQMLADGSHKLRQQGGPGVQAEQRMGESLGRSGGPTQHRALLMTPMVYTTPYWSDELDLRITPKKRGQGKPHQFHPLTVT